MIDLPKKKPGISFLVESEIQRRRFNAALTARGTSAVHLFNAFMNRWLEWQEQFPEDAQVPFPPLGSAQNVQAADLDAEAQKIRDWLTAADVSPIPVVQQLAKCIRGLVNDADPTTGAVSGQT